MTRLPNIHEYDPPTSAQIATRQNDDEALRLLLAQRRLYSKAKRWQSVRWVGLGFLGVAAPFVSVIWPGSALYVAGVTGVWLFVGRTALSALESRVMTKAAAVQEALDLYIFGMPETITRQALPSLEEMELLIQSQHSLREKAKREKLLDWYPIEPGHSGVESIAIAQRANAAYTDRLIRTAVLVWAAATLLWLGILITVSALSSLGFGTALLGVIFPLLPAALDVMDYLRSTWRAAHDRADLANTIQGRIESDQPITGDELISWQTQLFDLRRTTPQVPDWLYKLTRKRNEAAMHSVANRLRGHQGGEQRPGL